MDIIHISVEETSLKIKENLRKSHQIVQLKKKVIKIMLHLLYAKTIITMNMDG